MATGAEDEERVGSRSDNGNNNDKVMVYHEKQRLQFCLLHCLNNLLQVCFALSLLLFSGRCDFSVNACTSMVVYFAHVVVQRQKVTLMLPTAVIVVLLHLRVGLSLSVIPKWASKEREALRQLPPFKGEHLERTRPAPISLNGLRVRFLCPCFSVYSTCVVIET